MISPAHRCRLLLLASLAWLVTACASGSSTRRGHPRQQDEVERRELRSAPRTAASASERRGARRPAAWTRSVPLQPAPWGATPNGDHHRVDAAALRRTARRPNAPSAVHERLGERLAAAGQLRLAIDSLRRAALLCRDPVARARLAKKLAQTASTEDFPRTLRRRAIADLDAGALRRAEQQLHSARRAAPEPALDYRLLRDLHRRRGDRDAALAAALLAREHAHEADRAAEPLPIELARAGAAAAPPPR